MATYKTLGINRGGQLNNDNDITATSGAAPQTKDVELQIDFDAVTTSIERYGLLTALVAYVQRHPEWLR